MIKQVEKNCFAQWLTCEKTGECDLELLVYKLQSSKTFYYFMLFALLLKLQGAALLVTIVAVYLLTKQMNYFI